MFGPAFSGSEAFGLAHFETIKACPESSNSFERSPPLVSLDPSVTATDGDSHSLGKDEGSLPPHGISGLGRAEYSDRNAVAHLFQWWAEGVELFAKVPRDVFAEDTIRPALAGNAGDFGGEEALAGLSGALSGNAVVLAGIAGSEDMNSSTPRSSVEGEHVGPDRRRMKPPCFHRRDQRRGGSDFPLHVAYRARRRKAQILMGEHDAEFEPSDTGAEGENMVGT